MYRAITSLHFPFHIRKLCGHAVSLFAVSSLHTLLFSSHSSAGIFLAKNVRRSYAKHLVSQSVSQFRGRSLWTIRYRCVVGEHTYNRVAIELHENEKDSMYSTKYKWLPSTFKWCMYEYVCTYVVRNGILAELHNGAHQHKRIQSTKRPNWIKWIE